ncbi:hypothetical protein J1P26_22060 [Neobacillus sp. MM2021_6]|uniref:hypothetical protein n=1 Tax=Bacillaceae TaxID=186817 RepID=UPI0014073D77|nr:MULTISPECIES: hypothetical protein [Bacillaceae]MBO0962390.1 hypothetical protein [Neobacillus sp. MM2021_6]NHC21041.1 hypothetical protein [Bacillus sp. MM2020_4]
MNITVIAGTAIRAVNTFYNFDGKPQDPQLVKFKVYDRSYKLLEDYILSDANKLSEGKYFYDYATPDEPYKSIILEFYGEIAGNKTIERKQIITTFIKG